MMENPEPIAASGGAGEPDAAEIERPYPFWGYEDLMFFAALAVPCFLIAFLLARAILAFSPWSPESKAILILPPQFLGYALWFLSLWAIFRKRYKAPFWPSLNWTLPKPLAVPSLLYGLLLALFVSLAGVLLRTPMVDTPMSELLNDPLSIALVGTFAVTLGPVCEELAFRGFLMPLLMRSFGVIAGIVIASLPFALLHGPQYAWAWQYVLLITLAGCAFGWMRHKTGSTAAAALMHAAYNLTFFAAYLAQKELMR